MSNKNDNSKSSSNEWKVGDICYRKGEKCKIKQIDFNTNPPSVTVQVLSDGHEINTEFSKLTKPKTITNNNKEMDEQNKKDLSEIQQWFYGLTIVEKDDDLIKLIPDMLPKLLFKLNNKNIHNKLQTEILQMISHISSRIQGHKNGYNLIPINVLINMLFQHIEYYNHNKSFYISPYFINLTITFIDMALKTYIKSLYSQHLSNTNSNLRIIYPKLDINQLNNDTSSNTKQFLNKQLFINIFKLLTLMDKFPNIDHSYKIFHFFIQILPFIKYSKANIDKNAQFFSSLFKINFDQLTKNLQQKKAEAQKQKQNENNNKILKKSYNNNTNNTEQKDEKNNDSDSDDDDDDEDDNDEDIIMINEVEEDDIVQKIVKNRKLGVDNDNPERITAVILTNPTPIISISHIKLLIEYCTDFLLVRHLPNKDITDINNVYPPSGLSRIIHEKISKHFQLLDNKTYLEDIHKSIIDFFYFIGVTCQMISVNEMFIGAMIATFNGNIQYVSNAAERLYSKIKSDVNIENINIVNQLYQLYLGSTDKTIRETQRRIPCSLSLKLAVITHLCKSNRGCNEFPGCVRIIFDSFFGKRTYLKLKLMGLQFTKQIFDNAKESQKLRKLTPVFKTGLLKLLKYKPQTTDEYIEPVKVRNIVYSIIGHLATLDAAKKLFTKNLDILKLYFDRLETEEMRTIVNMKESILDGLKLLKDCFKSQNNKQLLQFLLDRMDAKHTSNRTRVVILEWLNDIFPFDNAHIRMINIFQLDYNDNQIKEYATKGLQPRISRDLTAPKSLMERNKMKLENYPSFTDFTNIAYKQIIKSNRKVSNIIMKETIGFAAKCLKLNTIKWNQINEEKQMSDNNKDNMILNWLESNDETNEFRNESFYKSLRKQSKYIAFALKKSNDSYNNMLNGFEKYINLILFAIKNFQISQSKTATLHSIAFQYLINLICVCYPSFKVDVKLLKLFGNVLFDNNNLNLFYNRQIKDSILTRIQCSKLFAIITLLCKSNNNNNVINNYQSILFKSIASHLSYEISLKNTKNISKLKPNDLLNGTIQQTIELDGALRGLSTIISAKLYFNTDIDNITTEISLIAWLCTIFVLSKNMDLIQSSCYSISMFGKYNISNLLNDKQISSSFTSQLCSILNTDSNIINDIQNIIQVCSVKPNDSADDISRISDELALIEYLTLIIKRYNKNHRHIAESAIQALAAIAGGVRNMAQLTKIQENVMSLRKLSQEELQFSIGSVWANIVASVDKITDDNKDNNDNGNDVEMKDENNNNENINEPAIKKQKIDPKNANQLDEILSKICNDQMRFGNKLARQAACIWLLCIVRFSGNLQCIQKRLLMIQTAFISSLSDSNMFTVECASKGLAHCYEMAKKANINNNNNNGDDGDDLLRSLLSTLGRGKSVVHKDTEIQHKEGTTTYKELCEIAKNLNQPELAYRFLDLANNHAIWNSKRGAAFSLGSLLKISSELTDKMDAIIPILFRYKFDVNPSIRSTMQNLWRSIIASNKNGYSEDEIIEKHFDNIMTNVIGGLQSKEWRLRASTPLAVSALISGKRFNDIKKYLKELIENLFLVIQDINSMVKKSSIAMAQSILNLIGRLVNPDLTNSKHVIAALNIIIPIIIDPVKAGIETRSEEAQALSVTMLIKICTNKTGKYLCPHLKALISILLIGLSTLEPSQLGYLAVQDQGDEFANKVESARLGMSRRNPLNNALDTCIDNIDDIDTINSVIPELANIIRGGIGLNSLNASCKILNNLSSKKYLHKILKKHSRRVMNALLGQIVITNSPHLKTQYSSVIGHWCLFIKKKYVEQTMQVIENLYFNIDGNENKRILSSIIAYNISKYSLDVIKKYNKILGLSFIGTFDLNKECSEYWIKTIDECGGKQICLIVNLDITIELIIKTLNDSTYSRKQIAIISISNVCKLCKDDLDIKLLNKLINEILNILPGQIWDGKIKLFEALNNISKHCYSLINKDKNLKENIIKSLLIQIQRKRLEFRIAAINAFGEIVVNLNKYISNINDKIIILNECIPIINNIFNEYNNKEKKMISEMQITDHKKRLEIKDKFKKDVELLCCTIKFIGNIWNGNKIIQQKYLSFVINNCYVNYLEKTDWMGQITIYKSMQIFCDNLILDIMDKKLLQIWIEGVMNGLNDLKYTVVRHQSLCALYKILKLIKDKKKYDLIDNELMSKIKLKINDIATNDTKPIVVQQAVKLRKDIFS